jgi:FkbM family methyltransferase
MLSQARNPISSGRPFFGERSLAVYDILAKLPPGLMLDVGAAAGGITKRMLERSPQSRVIAFEPFPGNYPHFAKIVGDDPRVTLIKAAVSNKARKGKLFVASTVTGSEKNWEKMVGYSSAGFLVEDDDKRGEKSIAVDTVRIDDVVGNEHVRFMKIDVQGGELGVLQSAERAISEGRIDFMFVEFAGERDVLKHLLDRGMQIFDSEYLLIPKTSKADFSNWEIFRDLTLSSGTGAHRAWPRAISYSPDDYCRFFDEERKKIGFIWTDIVAVAPHFVEQFAKAAKQAA